MYTVVIDGISVTYDASSELPADATALIVGIADAINASSANTIVTASADPASPTDTVLIIGQDTPDFSFDGSVSGGTGAIALTAAPTKCDVQLFVSHGSNIADGSNDVEGRWVAPDRGLWSDIGYRGWMERLDTAGVHSAHLYVHNLTGVAGDGSTVTLQTASVMLGWSALEA